MPEIHWRIEGQKRVANDLRRWAAEFPDVLDDAIADFAQDRARHLRGKAYPPPPPNSTYVRTGNLGASWDSHKVKAAVWEIVNFMEYAGWVVHEKLQAWMHRGRWWTFQDEIRPAPDLTDDLVEALRGVIR